MRIDAHHQVGNLRPSITWQTSVIWLYPTEPPVVVAMVVARSTAPTPPLYSPLVLTTRMAWSLTATEAVFSMVASTPRFRMAGLHRIFRRVYIRKSRKAKGLAPEILPIDRSIV
jgi:hypothetical protein